MTPSQELKLIAVKYRWAYEELVFDAKMTEANQISNGGVKSAFQFLKSKFGSGHAVLLTLYNLIVTAGKLAAVPSNSQDALLFIARKHEWAFEEQLLIEKIKEANYIAEEVQRMYDYLKCTYGSGQEVLSALQQIISSQDGPRKSKLLKLA